MNKKAIIAMSGGVDSSVAAFLMKEKGYECIGATMKLFQNEDVVVCREHTCCSLDDVEDARSVARALEMPYYVFNFSDRFKEEVMEKFVCSYENGCTPNPCIDCNRYLKFEKLFQRAKELSYDYVVTGHYAQIEYKEETGRYLLKKSVDLSKDQSYVLYSLTQDQLAHVQFPLGGMHKTEAREIAEAQGFINARKHDSQDICFVVNGKYSDFIEQYREKTYPEGDFVDCNKLSLALYERTEKTLPLHKVVAENCKQEKKTIAALAVGCEGGISPEEMEILLEKEFVPVHFDVNILRCETASIYGLAALQSAFLEKELWEFKE